MSIPKSVTTLQVTFKISSFVAGIVFLFLSPLTFAQAGPSAFDKLSLRQQVGQVFIWTYLGTSFSPAEERWLGRYQPGALIVFSRNIQNPAQIAGFNSQTQKFAAQHMKAPFFLMIDQEGGTVTRLRTSVPLPSALALGKMADNKFIQSFGKATADVLHEIGFNVNLAPVLDISNPEKNSFIGSRAFGEDPAAVAEMAVAYSEGMNQGGMIPTAKHFPGHGGVVQDSHHATPKKLDTYEELADKDLVPFEEYAQSEFPRALMMAHLALPNVDPSGLPSTYSKVLIQDYLREKLKYPGLVITDDLEMTGASIESDIGERAVRAFIAGNDMLMLAGSPAHQRRAFNAVYKAVRGGRIPLARLKDSVERILAYKREMKIGTFTYNAKKTMAAIATLENLSREVLKKNFRLSIAGKTASWPEIKPDTEVLVLSSDKRFYDSFQAGFRGKAKFFLLTPQSLEKVAPAVNNDRYDLAVFYASGTQTARWISHLSPEIRAKTIVVNADHMGEVEDQKSFLSVLNINSRNPESGFSLSESLCSPEFRVPASDKDTRPPPEE